MTTVEPVGWTTPELVADQLGPSAAPAVDDPVLVRVVAAANAASFRRRREAGYTDDDTPGVSAPSFDVEQGATLWAVALWRERGSTDGFSSYAELETFTPTGGSWGQIRRMLGVGRGQVDTPAALLDPASTTARLLGRRRPVRWW